MLGQALPSKTEPAIQMQLFLVPAFSKTPQVPPVYKFWGCHCYCFITSLIPRHEGAVCPNCPLLIQGFGGRVPAPSTFPVLSHQNDSRL